MKTSVDPGHPAWEAARARLVAVLTEIGVDDPRSGYAELARAVAAGEGVDLPSWITMHLLTEGMT